MVVFKTDTGSILIKRVIGLPGEAVRYENDQLYVNNQPIAEPYLTKKTEKDHETMPYTTNFDSKELLMQEKNYLKIAILYLVIIAVCPKTAVLLVQYMQIKS